MFGGIIGKYLGAIVIDRAKNDKHLGDENPNLRYYRVKVTNHPALEGLMHRMGANACALGSSRSQLPHAQGIKSKSLTVAAE